MSLSHQVNLKHVCHNLIKMFFCVSVFSVKWGAREDTHSKRVWEYDPLTEALTCERRLQHCKDRHSFLAKRQFLSRKFPSSNTETKANSNRILGMKTWPLPLLTTGLQPCATPGVLSEGRVRRATSRVAGWHTCWVTFYSLDSYLHALPLSARTVPISSQCFRWKQTGSCLWNIWEASPYSLSSSFNWPFTFSNLCRIQNGGVGDEKRHTPKKGEEPAGSSEKIIFGPSVLPAE